MAVDDLATLLSSVDLSEHLTLLTDEAFTVALLKSMNLGLLSELGISAEHIARLERALRSPQPQPMRELLTRLGLERHVEAFEADAVTDVTLLASLHPSVLADNLEELGLDDAARTALTAELGALRKSSSAANTARPKPVVPVTPPVPPSRAASATSSACSDRSSSWDLDQLDAVYINLASRADRRTSMESALPRAGLTAERLDALQGAEVPLTTVGMTWDTALNARFDRNCKVEHALDLSHGERGCAASHAAAWRRCVARGRALLVLEDDLVFASSTVARQTRSFVSAIEASLRPAERTLILYLGAEAQLREGAPSLRGKQAIWAARAAHAGGCELREAAWAWQTHAYVVWPAAARVLLAAMPVDAPVDVFMSKLYYERTLCGLVAQPTLARQRDPYRGGDVEHSSLRDREKMFGGAGGPAWKQRDPRSL